MALKHFYIFYFLPKNKLKPKIKKLNKHKYAIIFNFKNIAIKGVIQINAIMEILKDLV